MFFLNLKLKVFYQSLHYYNLNDLKDKINFDVRIISSEQGVTISHNFDLNFKQYMDYLYFQNQWLEEEKYKCALENGEIKSFETELNDIQSDMIDICNEYSLELSDNIFIYINNGESFYSNHGYKIGGKCYKKENIAESGVSDEFDVREYIFDQIEDIFENVLEKKKMSLRCVCNLGIQMIEILEYIHNKNVIHRDIKPDNFLMSNGSNKYFRN